MRDSMLDSEIHLDAISAGLASQFDVRNMIHRDSVYTNDAPDVEAEIMILRLS